VVPAIALLCAAAFALRRRWPPTAASDVRTRRAAIATGCALVVLWMPPLIAEVTASSGNLWRLAHFFLASKEGGDVVGFSGGLGIAAAELAPWGAWIGRQQLGMMTDVLPAPIWQLALPLAAIGVSAAIAAARNDRLVLRLAVLLLVAVCACVVSYAQIHGLAFGYLAVWTRVVAMFCYAAPLIALARISNAAHRGRAAPGPAPLIVLGVCVLLVAFAMRASAARLPDEFQSRTVARFANAITYALPEHTRVRVAALGTPFTVSCESLELVLLRAGRDARMQCADPNVPGPHRCASSRDRLPTLALASGPGIQIYREMGGRVLAEFDPLSPAARAEADALRGELEAQLLQAKREDLVTPLRDAGAGLPWSVPTTVDQAKLAHYLKLAGGLDHLAFAVFLFPPGPF
jgi:hypothetical protein